MSARKPLSKKLRFDVFKRDRFSCQYCGKTPPQVVLEIDHIQPVAEGGTNDILNLLTACFDCNRGKGKEGLEAIPETVAQRAEVLAEKEEQIRAFKRLLNSKKRRENKEISQIEEILLGGTGYCFKDRFKESVRVFLGRLPYDTVEQFAWLSNTRIHDHERRLKYFCGCCWRIINGDDRHAG
jgi:hypothetical protein